MKRSNFLKSLVALPTLGGLANLATHNETPYEKDIVGFCHLRFKGVKILGTDKVLYDENIIYDKNRHRYIDITYPSLDCGEVDGIYTVIYDGHINRSISPIITNGSDLEIKQHLRDATLT